MVEVVAREGLHVARPKWERAAASLSLSVIAVTSPYQEDWAATGFSPWGLLPSDVTCLVLVGRTDARVSVSLIFS